MGTLVRTWRSLHKQQPQRSQPVQKTGQSDQSLPLCKYRGHMMGTNAISSSITASSSGTAAADEVEAVTVSGGDDGSATVCRFVVRRMPDVSRTAGAQPRLHLSLHLLSLVRVVDASGSAIKGIATDGAVVAACGYEQRLAVWRLHAPHKGEGEDGKDRGESLAKAERMDANVQLVYAAASTSASASAQVEVVVDGSAGGSAAAASSVPLELVDECVVEVSDVEDIAMTRLR